MSIFPFSVRLTWFVLIFIDLTSRTMLFVFRCYDVRVLHFYYHTRGRVRCGTQTHYFFSCSTRTCVITYNFVERDSGCLFGIRCRDFAKQQQVMDFLYFISYLHKTNCMVQKWGLRFWTILAIIPWSKSIPLFNEMWTDGMQYASLTAFG